MLPRRMDHVIRRPDLDRRDRRRGRTAGRARAGVAALVAVLAALWCFVSAAPVRAEDPDQSLTRHAVAITRTPKQDWPGYGIHLGRGLVLTAAHVAGRVAQTRPTAAFGGVELPVRAVKEGTFETDDLTLLEVDETALPVARRLRRLSLCPAAPKPGQEVIVAVPEGIARSVVVPPAALPPALRARFGTAIRDVATTGNSGSGVFDARTKCLLGIMSRRLDWTRPTGAKGPVGRAVRESVKYFVDARTIAGFLPEGVRY